MDVKNEGLQEEEASFREGDASSRVVLSREKRPPLVFLFSWNESGENSKPSMFVVWFTMTASDTVRLQGARRASFTEARRYFQAKSVALLIEDLLVDHASEVLGGKTVRVPGWVILKALEKHHLVIADIEEAIHGITDMKEVKDRGKKVFLAPSKTGARILLLKESNGEGSPSVYSVISVYPKIERE